MQIRAVAGPDHETTVIPEERRKYLSRYDAKSAHYEVASMQKPSEVSNSQSYLDGCNLDRCELAQIQNRLFS